MPGKSGGKGGSTGMGGSGGNSGGGKGLGKGLGKAGAGVTAAVAGIIAASGDAISGAAFGGIEEFIGGIGSIPAIAWIVGMIVLLVVISIWDW